MAGEIDLSVLTNPAWQRELAPWRSAALAAIDASGLRAAGDDLAQVIEQTHIGSEKRAWPSQ